MTALTTAAPAAGGALALREDELLPVLKSSLYPGAKDESIKLVLGYCKAAGLDPMQKPVHIVPMLVSTGKKNDRGYDEKEWRDVVMPGIGLYRTQAARTGELAGIDEPEFAEKLIDVPGKPGTQVPEWCRVTVYRMIGGQRVAFTALEFWLENYATAGRDSVAPNAMWSRRPRGQLAKCAEAQALRKAFPELGSQPTADETVFADEVIDAATGEPLKAASTPAAPKVARKPAAAAAPAEVTDAKVVEPAATTSPAPAPEQGSTTPPPPPPPAPATEAGAKTVGSGEIAYLTNKAKSIGVDLAALAAESGGLIVEAGKLLKTDFDTLKAELIKRGA